MIFLSASQRRELLESGFVIVPGPFARNALDKLAHAYDAAVESADPAAVRIGRTTTRVNDLVNCGPEFEPLYIYPPALAVCELIINQPFKLSTLLARTLRPHSPAQDLHVDSSPAIGPYPMVGFIFMVDQFTRENGATRFVSGPHLRTNHAAFDSTHAYEQEIYARGPAGSMILYNSSVRHGHGANVARQMLAI